MTQKVPPPISIEKSCDDGVTYLIAPDVGYEVASWRPGPPNSGPPTQVHLLVGLPIPEMKAVIRIKSARALDELVGILLGYRDEVWPSERKPD